MLPLTTASAVWFLTGLMTAGKSACLCQLAKILQAEGWGVRIRSGEGADRLTSRNGCEVKNSEGHNGKIALLIDEAQMDPGMLDDANEHQLVVAAGLPINGLEQRIWDEVCVLKPMNCQHCGSANGLQQCFTWLGRGPQLDFQNTQICLRGQHKWRILCNQCCNVIGHMGANDLHFPQTWERTSMDKIEEDFKLLLKGLG